MPSVMKLQASFAGSIGADQLPLRYAICSDAVVLSGRAGELSMWALGSGRPSTSPLTLSFQAVVECVALKCVGLGVVRLAAVCRDLVVIWEIGLHGTPATESPSILSERRLSLAEVVSADLAGNQNEVHGASFDEEGRRLCLCSGSQLWIICPATSDGALRLSTRIHGGSKLSQAVFAPIEWLGEGRGW